MLVRSTKWCISDTGFHGVIRWPDRLILLWHGSWAYPLIHIHLFHWNKHCRQEYHYQHVLVKSLDFGSSFLHLSCTHIAKTTTNKQVLTFFFGKMSQIKQDIWLEPNIILKERTGKELQGVQSSSLQLSGRTKIQWQLKTECPDENPENGKRNQQIMAAKNVATTSPSHARWAVHIS